LVVLVHSQVYREPTVQELGATQLGWGSLQHTWPGPPHGAQTFVRSQATDGSVHVPFAQHGRPARPHVGPSGTDPSGLALPPLPTLAPLPALPLLPAVPALLPPLPTAPAPAEPTIVPVPPSFSLAFLPQAPINSNDSGTTAVTNERKQTRGIHRPPGSRAIVLPDPPVSTNSPEWCVDAAT